MIYIVGIGPGKSEYLTNKAKELIKEATVLIGSARQLEIYDEINNKINIDNEKEKNKEEKCSVSKYGIENGLKNVALYIENIIKEDNGSNVLVLASGDPSLFGIGTYLSKQFDKSLLEIVPGISSTQYMFSRVKENMNDVYLTSCHGRDMDYDLIFKVSKCAILTDKKNGPFEIASKAISLGLNPKMYIGENLSYENEKITQKYANEIEDKTYDMNVVIIIN